MIAFISQGHGYVFVYVFDDIIRITGELPRKQFIDKLIGSSNKNCYITPSLVKSNEYVTIFTRLFYCIVGYMCIYGHLYLTAEYDASGFPRCICSAPLLKPLLTYFINIIIYHHM